MNIAKNIFIFLSMLFLWNCASDEVQETNEVKQKIEEIEDLGLPIAKEEKRGKMDLQASAAVGDIKEACQLVTEEWVQNNVPGFQNKEIKKLSRSSPDGNASACQCQVNGEKQAFVVGYKKSAGNLQFIQNLITDGMKKQDDFNVPPYQEVQGLGQRAAFSKYNGNLAWVSDEGLYLYMFIFPQSPEVMKEHFNVLYSIAPDINAVVTKYAGM